MLVQRSCKRIRGSVYHPVRDNTRFAENRTKSDRWHIDEQDRTLNRSRGSRTRELIHIIALTGRHELAVKADWCVWASRRVNDHAVRPVGPLPISTPHPLLWLRLTTSARPQSPARTP